MRSRPTAEFEAHRPRLFGLAYRMLGSAVDAEDAVQDAFLRWERADRGAIVRPEAWLVKVVTNLSLTRLTSARAERERYVGPWLPEPVLTADGVLGPLETAEQRDSVSFGLLVLLERLSPTERAVYVLREAFAYPHREIAAILDISEGNARQVHRRAKRHVADARPRFEPSQARWRQLVERFLGAAREGDLAALEDLLAEDVTSWSDGGGRMAAARRPVVGAGPVGRLYAGLLSKAPRDVRLATAEINAQPALLAWTGGRLFSVLVADVLAGRIVGLRVVVNPDKLAFVAAQAADVSHLRGLSGPS